MAVPKCVILAVKMENTPAKAKQTKSISTFESTANEDNICPISSIQTIIPSMNLLYNICSTSLLYPASQGSLWNATLKRISYLKKAKIDQTQTIELITIK